ncbi:MAG: CsgG/HfaB family protein [Fidelibacterota bacterium]
MAKIEEIKRFHPKPLKNGGRHTFVLFCLEFLFFLMALFTFLSAQIPTDSNTEKPTIAILDFEARGVSPQEVQTLSERMRTEIGNTNAVRLIERKAVDKIMEEQGFQQTGCTTDECASEVGQLLGVQYMISGAIGLMGKTYTIDAKMFSVETGETIRTKSVSHKGDISGLLTEMEILAWEIVGLEAPTRLKLNRTGEEEKTTVAVLDFEGRGISLLEAQTLTDRFTSSMSGTNKVLMVERGTMADVLEEQGFESGGCTSDECAAEVGAMLGVQFMVSGAIGKLGDTYTIDVKMFSVATGAAENMQSVTYQGKVDGLITEIEILGWTILGLDPPNSLLQKKRLGTSAFLAQQNQKAGKTKMGSAMRSFFFPGFGQFYSGKKLLGYGWIAAEAALGGLIYLNYTNYTTAFDDFNNYETLYSNETDPQLIAQYKVKSQNSHADMDNANQNIKTMAAAAGAVWIVNVIHAYMVGPKSGETAYDEIPLQMAYDRQTDQMQFSLSIPLD